MMNKHRRVSGLFDDGQCRWSMHIGILAAFCTITILVFCAAVSPVFSEIGTGLKTPESQTVSSTWWGDLDLDDAAARLASTLVEQGRLKGQPVLISPHDLYDAQTGLSLPLANQLRGKLITEMKEEGVRVLLDGADEERFMILQGTWQKQGKYLAIDLKVMKLGSYGPEAAASASEKVPLKKIDASALTPDRESWARYLVRKLEQKTPDRNTRKVHMRDFKIKTETCSPSLGPYLADLLRPALSESRMFVPVDPQRALKGLSVTTLRDRGTRAIRPKLPATGLTTDLVKADAELRGEAWRHQSKIEVRAKIIGREGQQVTAASADIPSELFPAELLRPPARPQMPASSTLGAGTGEVSKDGLVLELATDRGEGRPTYRKDEHIRFLLRLNRPAWVYLFNLDPEANATLLYPVDEQGHLSRGGQCGALPKPGQPVILPEDGCAYDLVVTSPYGRDRVWAVAAESALQFPSDLSGDWKKADLLVKQLREQGLSQKGGYAEAELVVVTGP